MTTKTIGTGGDYSTINTWEADAPAGTLTAPWEGLCKNQEFNGGDGSGAVITLSGNTTDTTNHKILRTDTGASFIDNANKLTNALKYNASNGAAIYSGGAYQNLITVSENNDEIKNLQLKLTAGAAASRRTVDMAGSDTVNPTKLLNCIIERSGGGGPCVKFTAAVTMVNCLLVNRQNNNTAGIELGYSANQYVGNCTIVKTQSASATGIVEAGSTNVTVKNTAIFGFSTGYSGSNWTAGSGYNASDYSSAPGSNNQVSKTYSSQFENVTDASFDFRAKTGGDLVNGTRDATYTSDLDIVGSSRSTSTPTIGAWELPAAAAGKGPLIGMSSLLTNGVLLTGRLIQ